MKLRIGTKLIPVDSVEHAQEVYCRLRQESGEGYSTFREGQVFSVPRKQVARISYNGRVWDMKGNPVAADDVPGFDADIRHDEYVSKQTRLDAILAEKLRGY